MRRALLSPYPILAGAAVTIVSTMVLGGTGRPVEDEATTERFSTLAFRESPYPGFRGVVPLTPDEADGRNHYRFVRDSAGRLVEVSFRLGDALRAPDHSASHFFRAPLVRIEHVDGRELRRFFDERERPIAVAGGVFEEEHTVDPVGYRTALVYRDRDGAPVDDAWGISSYHWATASDGSVTEWRKNAAGESVSIRPGFEFGVLELRYDVRGLLAVMRNLARGGGLLENASGAAQDKIEYDARGAQTAWNVLDAKGDPQAGNHPGVARGLMERDRWGYLIGLRYEDERGRPMRNRYGWGRGVTTYDRFGNWAARAFFDERGEPMVVERLGYHRYDFTWDRTGLRLLALEYSDVEGRTVVHAERGYARVEYDWDDRGNRTAVRYLDVAGKPVDRLDTGVALLAYEYDEDDFLVAERCLDAAGGLVADRRRGWATARHEYAADGFRTVTVYRDAAGRSVEP